MNPVAQEDKNIESDSPGGSLDPLESHTLSLKNNAAGPSLHEHENPLNGTQPNPFVYSSVPTVPHAGNSLPSGALVNGPGSHPHLRGTLCPEQRQCFIQQCPGCRVANGEGHKPWRCYHHPVSFNQTLGSTQQVASQERQPLGQVSTRHCLARKRISVNWPVPHSQVTVQPKCTLANLPQNRQWKQDLHGTQAGQEALQMIKMMLQ